MFHYTPLVAMYAITAAILGVIALYIWRRRDAPGGFYFSMLLVAGMWWAICSTFEMAAIDVQLKIFFSKLTYIGIVSIAPIWMLFNIAYSQRNRYVSGKLGVLLWVIPAISLVLAFTNEWHNLIWTSIEPVSPDPGAILIYGHGQAFLLLVVYTYSLMIVGTLMLIRASIRTYRQFRKQAVTLVLGALIPTGGNIIYVVWLGQAEGIDPTPFTLMATGLIFAWSMFRYRLFDLMPVARETLIASMTDGVIVIDDQGRVIDSNPAARRLVGGDIPIGQPVASVLARWPNLADCSQKPKQELVEVMLDDLKNPCWLDVRVSQLRDEQGLMTGRLMVMRDITKRKMAEKALDETRYNFQTLFDTVDDLLFIVAEDARVLEINKAVLRRLQYDREEIVGMDFGLLVPPESRGTARSAMREVMTGKRENGPRVLLARDGSQIQVETHVVPGMWDGRRALFGIACDITELVRQQETLREMNVSLSVEVEERKRTEKQIETALREKEVLLKEIHHRVKNNMQIISSLFNLQMSGVHSEEIIASFRESQNRITAMALVHEKLYQSGDLAHIDYAEYVHSLIDHLRRSYATSCTVNTTVDIDNVLIGIDQAIPCGLIINELVSNSLKYAFRDGRSEGNIRVSFRLSGTRCTLVVADDGIGLLRDYDLKNADSPCLQMVNTLVSQIGGTMTLDSVAGTQYTITFGEP